MKILHICNLIGGVGVYVRNTVEKIDDASIDYVVVRGRGDNTSPLTRDGEMVKEYEVDLNREISFVDLKCLCQIVKILRRERPDILHCHSAKAGFLGRIAGFICGVKTIYSPHGFSFLSATGLKSSLYLLLERLARLKSYILTGSNSENEIGINRVGYRADRSYNWNNTTPDALKIVEGGKGRILDPSSFNICSVGRPCYQKNIQFIIEVVKDLVAIIPESRFYIIGAGFFSPDIEEIDGLIERYGLKECVKVIEWLPQEDVFQYLLESDLYITAARYETLPLAVIEAMSLSCPVVASSTPGNRDCVFDGENGYSLPFDKGLFVSRIVELYNDKGLRERMGRRSRELFEEHFCIDTQIDKLKQIYKDISKIK